MGLGSAGEIADAPHQLPIGNPRDGHKGILSGAKVIQRENSVQILSLGLCLGPVLFVLCPEPPLHVAPPGT